MSVEVLHKRIERLKREREKARHLRMFYDERIRQAVEALRQCEANMKAQYDEHQQRYGDETHTGIGGQVK